MAGRRRRREADHEDVISLEVTGGGRARATLLDPRAPMQGDIKQVGGSAPHPSSEEVDKDDLRQKYRKFLARYRHEIQRTLLDKEYTGDPLVHAIKDTFGLSYEVAERDQYRLHAQMSEASKGASIGELLRRHGIGAEARAALVAHHANSFDPKVSLVAIKIANDMDEASADGAADSYEDWVALVMGGTD